MYSTGHPKVALMFLFSLAWLSLLSCIAGAEELLLDPEWPECVAGAGAETDSNPAPLTGPRHIGHRHGHSQRTIETLNPKKYFSVIFMRHDLQSHHSGLTGDLWMKDLVGEDWTEDGLNHLCTCSIFEEKIISCPLPRRADNSFLMMIVETIFIHQTNIHIFNEKRIFILNECPRGGSTCSIYNTGFLD